jgi:hypothetical protein
LTILSSTDLRIVLMSDLKVRPSDFGYVRDDAYMLPSPDWFLEVYPDALRRFQFHVGQFDPAPEANDCDDYALMGVAFAQLCHYKAEGRRTQTAFAIGLFSYHDALLGRHQVIFGVARHAAAYRLLCLDAQTLKPRELSRAEIDSCECYYI